MPDIITMTPEEEIESLKAELAAERDQGIAERKRWEQRYAILLDATTRQVRRARRTA
jgi:hypothetical protein